jgi:hypothetical protein
MLMSYDPQTVLANVDRHAVGVTAFMTLCLVCTFVYLVSAFRTSRRDRSFPAPLSAVGWFAIHDANFVFQWNDWFHVYHHWWLESWAVALIFTSAIEFALCFQVYQYGRRELMPKLTQRQFGIAVIGCLIGIGVVWVMIKSILDDPLYLIAFAVTAWWPPVWATLLLVRRQSMRGQTMLMNWCLLGDIIGMSGAWFFLDPWFRSPPFIAFTVVTIGWNVFNLWVMNKYPKYDPATELRMSGQAGVVAI